MRLVQGERDETKLALALTDIERALAIFEIKAAKDEEMASKMKDIREMIIFMTTAIENVRKRSGEL